MALIAVTAPLWIGLVFGILFGAIGEVWGLGNPETLIRLARWKDRFLVSCLAVACAVGAVTLYGLYALGFAMHFSPKPVYVYGVVIGGLLFGAGMAVGGYVPGSELMGLGEGRRDALYAVPGGLLGAAAWTVVYQTAPGRWLTHTADYGDLIASGSVHQIRPLFTFLFAALYAGALLLGAALLPRYSRGKSCLVRAAAGTSNSRDQTSMSDTAAYLAEGGLPARRPNRLQRAIAADVPSSNPYSRMKLGTSILIGLLVVAAIFLHQIFGESTTYSWLAGKLFFPDSQYTDLVNQKVGWEPLSDLGTIVGALLASLLISRHFQGFRPVIPPSWRERFGENPVKRAMGSFGGAYIMMFGARMADGCMSGHLLSGGVQMAASAWLFGVAVFVAMIATARLVYRRTSDEHFG